MAVQDLFGNMPVRVKHRAVGSANGEGEKQLESLKKQIVGLLLAWHKPVSISLKDTQKIKTLRLRGKEDPKIRKAGDQISLQGFNLILVAGLLSHAGYIEPSGWDDWIKTSARTPFVTIRAAISTEPAPSKQVQFMSLGIRSINAETSGNVLYDEVNRLFALSSFGNQEEILDREESSNARRSKDRRFKQDGFTNKQLKGGGKGVDRWPMFYVRVDLENQALEYGDDVGFLREGKLSRILKVLGAMITEFLEETHFRPRAGPQRRKLDTPTMPPSFAKSLSVSGIRKQKQSPIVTNSCNQERDFSTWSRIKSGTCVVRHAAIPSLDALQSQEIPTERVKLGLSDQDVEPAVPGPAKTLDDTEPNRSNGQDSEQTIEWRNPISGATVLINARTGLVLAPRTSKRPAIAPSRSSTSPSWNATGAPANAAFDPNKRLTRNVCSPFRTPTMDTWSSELLKKWENPIFATSETDIPQVSLDGPSIETSDILHGRRHCCTDLDIEKAFTQSSSSLSAKLSKKTLKQAKVISQVDQKFILIAMGQDTSASKDDAGQLLGLVDQHAADERIRVEGLLAELCSHPTPLIKPIVFEIPAREHELMIRHAAYLASWGIVYDVKIAAGPAKCRLSIRALPSAIAERCRVEPKVLIEMLRGEVWKRKESGSNPSAKRDLEVPFLNASKTDGWLARLGTCPQGLLDMLNSRACRSAIMFNDELSVSECQMLISRLGDCAFPFQCAHGRPSMIPLVKLGTSMSIGKGGHAFGARKTPSDMGFGEAWKRWNPSAEKDTDTL